MSTESTQALLLLNGELTRGQWQRVQHRSFQRIICTDGALQKALKLGIPVQVVVGDLDSVTEIPANIQAHHLPSQEKNDLEKALQFCLQEGLQQVVVLGIGGGRLDHALSNLSVLYRYHNRLHLEMHDAFGQIYFVEECWRGNVRPGQVISLIPIGQVQGVQTIGLHYPLQGESLGFGQREGLSNYAEQSQVEVRIARGLLILFLLEIDG